jgi:aspartate/methionine/tyrosine aminotransferase
VFSARAGPRGSLNALAVARARRLAAGLPLLDLTQTNPTQVGLSAPLAPLTVPEAYTPEPLGAWSAREALAAHVGLDPARLLLCASTSEAFSWLFTLLADAGDEVLVPHPGYPLFDDLARLAQVTPRPFALDFDGQRFGLEPELLRRAATPRTRALVLVSPANPTGQRLTEVELHAAAEVCARHGWALILDEVFRDPELHGLPSRASLPCLTFTLGGLSKSCGLPQLKLSWVSVSGPGAAEALERLEHLADTFLPVNTPVMHALPGLLEAGRDFRGRLRARLSRNDAALRASWRPGEAWQVLPREAGWLACLRVPEQPQEEARCLALLDAGVAVQPGYFFDFPRGAWLVVSLLPEPQVLDAALEALRRGAVDELR